MSNVYGLDLEQFSADEIVEKIGIARFPNNQLLEAFLELLDQIEYSLRRENNYKRDKVQLEAAPTAYEVYKRFYSNRKEPILFPHPSLKSEYLPSAIQFWIEPVAVSLLFKMMIEDGNYQPSTFKNRKWMPAPRFYESIQ